MTSAASATLASPSSPARRSERAIPHARILAIKHLHEVAQRTDLSDAFLARNAYDALDAYERYLVAYIDIHANRLARSVLQLRVNRAVLARITECTERHVQDLLDGAVASGVAREATAEPIGASLLITIVLNPAPPFRLAPRDGAPA